MILRCKRCKKSWDYQGKIKPRKYPQYTSCPRCKTSIKIIVCCDMDENAIGDKGEQK